MEDAHTMILFHFNCARHQYFQVFCSFSTAGTPYAGGLFRLKLVLGKTFPAEPPKAFFLTTIFHPNVAKNGEICVNTLKKDWKSSLGIKHVLLVSNHSRWSV